jgi:hypothetical protein
MSFKTICVESMNRATKDVKDNNILRSSQESEQERVWEVFCRTYQSGSKYHHQIPMV